MPEISQKAIEWLASTDLEYRDNDYVWICDGCGNILSGVPSMECCFCGCPSHEMVYRYYDLIPPEMYDEGYDIVSCVFCGKTTISNSRYWQCKICQEEYDKEVASIEESYDWEE